MESLEYNDISLLKTSLEKLESLISQFDNQKIKKEENNIIFLLVSEIRENNKFLFPLCRKLKKKSKIFKTIKNQHSIISLSNKNFQIESEKLKILLKDLKLEYKEILQMIDINIKKLQNLEIEIQKLKKFCEINNKSIKKNVSPKKYSFDKTKCEKIKIKIKQLKEEIEKFENQIIDFSDLEKLKGQFSIKNEYFKTISKISKNLKDEKQKLEEKIELNEKEQINNKKNKIFTEKMKERIENITKEIDTVKILKKEIKEEIIEIQHETIKEIPQENIIEIPTIKGIIYEEKSFIADNINEEIIEELNIEEKERLNYLMNQNDSIKIKLNEIDQKIHQEKIKKNQLFQYKIEDDSKFELESVHQKQKLQSELLYFRNILENLQNLSQNTFNIKYS